MSLGDGTITDSSAYQIVRNPEIDGVNKSNYCVKIDYKSTFTSWGFGDSFGINNSIFIKFIEESTEQYTLYYSY